jgi:hypothetical protein
MLAWSSVWGATCFDENRARAVTDRRFQFLNKELHLPSIDWGSRYVSHLWSYNLHYFDYSIDLAAAFRRDRDPRYLENLVELIQSWIDGATPGRGDGWQAYPTSLRTVNWLLAASLVHEDLPASFLARLSGSVASQLVWLDRILEKDVDANHLLKNLKALAIGGMTGRGPVGQRLVDFPARFVAELKRQLTPDGLHYERSPLYHAIALRDALDCLPLLKCCQPARAVELEAIIVGMGRPLQLLSRLDGSLHLFGDTANWEVPIEPLLRAVSGFQKDGAASADGAWMLPASGYHGWSDHKKGERIVITCSEPSPAHQPGHSHCDILSFELDIGGHPLIVDSGVSGYESDPLREYVRSTRAHNTFGISGKEQSEVWGTFRVARRASVESVELRTGPFEFSFRGAYRPYYSSNVVFSRRIEKRPHGWRIIDSAKGAAGAELQSFLHFHPACSVRREEQHLGVSFPGGQVLVRPFGACDLQVVSGRHTPEQGWYCPAFGQKLESAALIMRILPSSNNEFGYEIVTC